MVDASSWGDDVRKLKAAIRFLDQTNNDPKPITWTADPDKVVAAVKRGRQLLEFDPLALILTHFARTGINPGFKSEGMLRSKMLLV